METAGVVPYSFAYTSLQLLTKLPGFRPRRMARREGDETSGAGPTGMLSLPDPLGGGARGLALSNGVGRGGSSERTGMRPRPRDLAPSRTGRNNGGRDTSGRPEVELGVQGSASPSSVTILNRNYSACPPRPGGGGSGPPHRAAHPSPPCAPDVTPRRGKRGGGRDGSHRLGRRNQGATAGPAHVQPPFALPPR